MFGFLFLSVLVTSLIFLIVFYYFDFFDTVFDSVERVTFSGGNKHSTLSNSVKKQLISGENSLKCVNYEIKDKIYTEHIALFPTGVNRTIVVTTNKNAKINGNINYVKGVENENSVSYAFNVKQNVSPKIQISHLTPNKFDSIVNVFSRF